MFVVPIAITQFWLLSALSLVFVGFLIRAMARRRRETGGRRATSSRVGIFVQGLGMALVGPGIVRPTLPWSSLPAIAGCLAVLLLAGPAIALFASSSAALGKNWSFEARTRSDHELIRCGPYAYVRHPIYLGMMLFMLGWAVALGHWANLIVAVPIFLVGTSLRTAAEDRVLEASFGQDFIAYRNSTPALFPRRPHQA
jgi:protein-S-isoprenylcysteine O-methyltransferase Ste14